MTQFTIGRYEIREELGEGGMGTVYLAYDPTLGREVALKVLQPQLFMQDPEFAIRFEREARTVASLEHSSIVSLYEFGEDGEWLYIVMRLMKGGTLNDRLAKGAMSLDETISIMQRIGGALDTAHSRGIVHRDLKPANILFDEDGGAFLSDFGIVKAEDATGLKTRTGQSLGTPQYMSPEQLDGKEVDGRSDIYSLGVVLFEMLSGKRPYDHQSLVRLAIMHLTFPVPSIVEVNSGLPPELEAVIQTAMAKEPEARYATAAEMTEALKRVATNKSASGATYVAAAHVVSTPEPEPSAKTYVESSPAASEGAKNGGMPAWIWWAGAAVIVLLLILGIGAMFRGGDETPEATEGGDGDTAVLIANATDTRTSVLPALTSTAEPTTTATASPSPTTRPLPTDTPIPAPTATPGRVKYTITIHTGCEFLAGTDANVYITLFGQKGESNDYLLDNPGVNDHETCESHTYQLELTDLGEVEKIRIRHDNAGFAAGWYLNGVFIRNESTGEERYFPNNQWLATDEGDGQISRELDPG